MGVEVFLGSQSRSRKIMVARVGVEKICSTLTTNLSQEWKAFYAMNKLSKYSVGLSKSRPASVLQIS